jgi:arsenite oxidase small subunit
VRHGLGDKEDSSDQRDSDQEINDKRRGLLKLAVAFSLVLGVGGIAAVAKSITNPALLSGASTASGTFPKVKVANVNDLQVNQPVFFNYPLDNEPNILVKLGQKASGGVGPNGDIVAFSQICQHLGCIYAYEALDSSPPCNASYKAPGPVGYCCCHGSIYDFLNGAKVISGPSPRPEPQVTLSIDASGDIYAVGMSPPSIFGHNTGSNDVSADLQGGSIVS